MYWTADRTWFGIAVLLYGIATGYAVFLWRRGFSRNDWWCYGILALAAIPHSIALFARGFSLQRCPVQNLYEATMFISWTILACHLAAGIWSRLRFLSAFAAPVLLALGVFGMNGQLDTQAQSPELARGLVSLHAALILLAYGTFGLSAASAILYLSQERDLKIHKLRAVLSHLPSIERLETIVVRSLVVGVILLTLGLVPTFWLVDPTRAPLSRSDVKVLWSLLVWGGYLTILVMRFAMHRGARWTAWGSLGSFTFVMLTFWGTNLLSPMHQP